jgi:hypothetical protein
MPDLTKLNASSQFGGLKNYGTAPLDIVIPAQTLAANSYVQYAGSLPVTHNGGITNIQCKLDGLETRWRPLHAALDIWQPNAFTFSWDIYLTYYFEAGNLVIQVFVRNNTGSPIAIGGFTVKSLVSFYVAPFN